LKKQRLFRNSTLNANIAFFIVFVTGQVTANAATIYVHPPQGAPEGSYHTIQEGVDAASAEDMVMVAPGNYESFTVNKEVYVVSEAGPDVTYITSGGPVTFNDPGDGALISGFTVSLGGIGIYITNNCDHVKIENNIISGCGSHGVYVYANGSYTEYSTVVNNTISNNGGSRVYLRSYYGGMSSIIYYIANLQIVNNIITSNNNYGIQFYNQLRTGIGTHNFSNNNLWNNTAGDISGVTVDSSAGNIFTDPFFVNQGTADYHTQAASPCIDAGTVGKVYNDPDGTRNDIGVYGGPGAADFWPSPASGKRPVVTGLSITPPSILVGGTLTLKATGKIQ